MQKFGWVDAAKIVLALIVSGFAWSADNQAGVISLVAMLIVWILGVVLKQFGWRIGKTFLTALLFVVAIGLAVLFEPVAWPMFPAWSGDVAMFASALMVWLGAVVSLGGQVVIWATAHYNILLAKVLEKFEPGVG